MEAATVRERLPHPRTRSRPYPSSPIPDIPVVLDRFPGVYLSKFRTPRRKGARGVTDKQGVNGTGVASHASVERVKVTGWPIVSQNINLRVNWL